MSNRLLRQSFSLLHVDHVALDDKWNYANVISPYFRIYYIDAGEGYVISGREKIKLEQGFLYIIPCFTLCHLRCDDYLSQYFLHFFEESAAGISIFEYNRKVIKVPAIETDIANFKRLLEMNPGRGINRSNNPKVYEKNIFYKGYQELNNLASDSAYLETQGIMLQLISRFLGSNRFKSKSRDPVPSKIADSHQRDPYLYVLSSGWPPAAQTGDQKPVCRGGIQYRAKEYRLVARWGKDRL